MRAHPTLAGHLLLLTAWSLLCGCPAVEGDMLMSVRRGLRAEPARVDLQGIRPGSTVTAVVTLRNDGNAATTAVPRSHT